MVAFSCIHIEKVLFCVIIFLGTILAMFLEEGERQKPGKQRVGGGGNISDSSSSLFMKLVPTF